MVPVDGRKDKECTYGLSQAGLHLAPDAASARFFCVALSSRHVFQMRVYNCTVYNHSRKRCGFRQFNLLTAQAVTARVDFFRLGKSSKVIVFGGIRLFEPKQFKHCLKSVKREHKLFLRTAIPEMTCEAGHHRPNSTDSLQNTCTDRY